MTELTDRDAAILWARQILETDFVVLDTETTGLDYDDEAVSIGLVSKAGDVLLDTLLCHEKRCGARALEVHGITWEMTRAAPKFVEIAPRFYELVGQRDIVAYNVGYDMRIISQMVDRYGIEPANSGYFPGRTVHDVMGAFAQFYGDWNDYHYSYTWKKLTFAARHFGIETGGAHGAAGDALMTLRVIEAMAREKLSNEPEQL
jgi:DNA polymerase-3 subunit epsilon